jgi:hypothetical protein
MAAGQEQCADIEGPLGAEVDAFIEQRGPPQGGRHVDEPVAVQHVEDRLLLLGAQGTRLPPWAVRDRRRVTNCQWAVASDEVGREGVVAMSQSSGE